MCDVPSPFPSSSSSNPKKALVIGVSEYDSRPLTNPTNDAVDISAMLRSIAFDVTTLTCKTCTVLDPLHTSIRTWIQKLNRNDTALFYFSGHGAQDEKHRNFLLPSDNSGIHSNELLRRAIYIQEQVLEAVQLQNVKYFILLLDCCRDNAVIGTEKMPLEGLSRIQINPLKDSITITIAYACAPGCTADDGGGRNGWFTKHLLKWLATPNMELDAALKKVTAGVIEESQGKQRPYRDTNSHEDIILYKVKEEETVPVLSIPASDLEYIQMLGEGGFGIVYRGRWISQDLEVAIKKLRVGIGVANEKDKAEFMNELRVHYSLRTSEFVVPLYGACMEPGHYALVMKYMAGGHLGDALRNGLVTTWKQKWDIAVQVVRAVNFLHLMKPQVLHRDIKAANFLLTWNMKKVKMSDFGLSKVQDHSSSHFTDRTVGTLRYMAPEKFKLGSKFTLACDMFSVGIVLWEIATGEVPYGGENESNIREAVRAGERLDIHGDVPAEYRDLIVACWEHDPSKRIVATEALRRAKQGQLIEENQCEMNGRQAQADTQRNQITSVTTSVSSARSTSHLKHDQVQGYSPNDPADVVRALQCSESEDLGFIAAACGAIATLTKTNGHNRIILAGLGGVAALLSVMKQHEANADVMDPACGALSNLSLNADNKVSVARLGGLELLLSVMKQHQENAAVMGEACGALRNLSLNADNQVTVARLGGLELLLSVMKQHQENAAVMNPACCALGHLSINTVNGESIARLGGLELLLSVIEQHQTDAAVIDPACGALSNLSGNTDHQVSVARLGGLELLLSVMKQYQANAAVINPACATLMNLSMNADNQVSVAHLGGLELLLSVMKQH